MVAGQQRKLLNRVDTQVPSQHAAGGTVGVVVETDAVQPIVVLLRPRPGDGQLLTETTISSISAGREVRLGLDRVHTRLKLRQIGPTAAVERQFTDRGRVYHSADVGGRELHGGNFTLHHNRFVERTDA